MIVWLMRTDCGKPILELRPESCRDHRLLEEMDRLGVLDTAHSFADYPEHWRAAGIDPRDRHVFDGAPRRRRRRRGRRRGRRR